MTYVGPLNPKFFPVPKTHAPALPSYQNGYSAGYEEGLRVGRKEGEATAILRLTEIQKALDADFAEPPPPKITMADIVEQVAVKHGLETRQLFRNTRNRKVVVARHEAWSRCAVETVHSLAAIGRYFGGFDHSSVANGIRRHEERTSPSVIPEAIDG